MQVVNNKSTPEMKTAVNRKAMFYIFGLLAIVCGLYSPFELTRVLLLIRDGYNVVVPWYYPFEIAAIWLGFSMVLGLSIWAYKSKNQE
jgi:hypothetical protein